MVVKQFLGIYQRVKLTFFRTNMEYLDLRGSIFFEVLVRPFFGIWQLCLGSPKVWFFKMKSQKLRLGLELARLFYCKSNFSAHCKQDERRQKPFMFYSYLCRFFFPGTQMPAFVLLMPCMVFSSAPRWRNFVVFFVRFGSVSDEVNKRMNLHV